MQQWKRKNKVGVFFQVVAGMFVLAAVSTSAYGSTIINGQLLYTTSAAGGGSGTFTQDDNEVFWQFQIQTPGIFTVSTSSFALGGFAANLTLFHDDLTPGNPTGGFIAMGTEGSPIPNSPDCGPRAIDTTTDSGYCFDSYLQTNLEIGNYFLVLTEDPNVAIGQDPVFGTFGDGFIYRGTGDFTSELLGYNANNSQPNFWLFDNTPRSGQYEVTATFDVVAPEPHTLPLALSVLLVCFGVRFRQKRRVQ